MNCGITGVFGMLVLVAAEGISIESQNHKIRKSMKMMKLEGRKQNKSISDGKTRKVCLGLRGRRHSVWLSR